MRLPIAILPNYGPTRRLIAFGDITLCDTHRHSPGYYFAGRDPGCGTVPPLNEAKFENLIKFYNLGLEKPIKEFFLASIS